MRLFVLICFFEFWKFIFVLSEITKYVIENEVAATDMGYVARRKFLKALVQKKNSGLI